MDKGIIRLPGGVTRRSGLKLLAKYDNGVDRLEAVKRGNWYLVKATLRDGSIKYLDSNGPVVIDGGIS